MKKWYFIADKTANQGYVFFTKEKTLTLALPQAAIFRNVQDAIAFRNSLDEWKLAFEIHCIDLDKNKITKVKP